jgi:hypothetical protein
VSQHRHRRPTAESAATCPWWMGVRWAIAPPSGHASATLAAATGNRLGASSAPADFDGDPPRNPAARGRAGQLTCDPPRARYGYFQTPSAFGLPCLPVLRPMAAATCPTTRGNRKLSGKGMTVAPLPACLRGSWFCCILPGQAATKVPPHHCGKEREAVQRRRHDGRRTMPSRTA